MCSYTHEFFKVIAKDLSEGETNARMDEIIELFLYTMSRDLFLMN